MIKIALVTAFSERCIPLVKQCILSAMGCMRHTSAEYTIYAYTYNWTGLEQEQFEGIPRKIDIEPFSITVNLQEELLTDIPIIQPDACLISREQSLLPDMHVYHDFATKHLKEYDYALFCHDDIVFNDSFPLFEELLRTVNDPMCAFIGEAHIECLQTLSIRIYPHFIFVKTSVFQEMNLSFINDYLIFQPQIRCRPPRNDGGAGLLASLYSQHQIHSDSCQKPIPVSKKWFKHLRIYHDAGIETHNIYQPNTPQFKQLIDEAQKYVDIKLFGERH